MESGADLRCAGLGETKHYVTAVVTGTVVKGTKQSVIAQAGKRKGDSTKVVIAGACDSSPNANHRCPAQVKGEN